jgi:GTP cyclohydrolase III
MVLVSMRMVLWSLSVVLAVTVLALPTVTRASENAADLAKQALDECEAGQNADTREARKEHFERGEALATQAVALDDRNASAHFGIVCNLGELLRIDGEKITSIFELRRLMNEVDRTLRLDPNHVDAMATKGNLLVRLPRVLGGNPAEGERLLREVVQRDDAAVTSRITLAKTCEARGARDEAVGFASRALEVAKEQGRADKVAEAQATLDELSAKR